MVCAGRVGGMKRGRGFVKIERDVSPSNSRFLDSAYRLYDVDRDGQTRFQFLCYDNID